MNKKILCIVILIILVLILFFNLKKQESFQDQEEIFENKFNEKKKEMQNLVSGWRDGVGDNFEHIVSKSGSYMLMYIMSFAIKNQQRGLSNTAEFINDYFNKYLDISMKTFSISSNLPI